MEKQTTSNAGRAAENGIAGDLAQTCVAGRSSWEEETGCDSEIWWMLMVNIRSKAGGGSDGWAEVADDTPGQYRSAFPGETDAAADAIIHAHARSTVLLATTASGVRCHCSVPDDPAMSYVVLGGTR